MHSTVTNRGKYIVVILTCAAVLAVGRLSRPFYTPDSNSRFQFVQSLRSDFYSLAFCSFVVMAMSAEYLRKESFVVGCRGRPAGRPIFAAASEKGLSGRT